jgi:DNA-binding response OmpR family regulator
MPALILVVDDDWMNREIVETYLTLAGYRVNTAENGVDALQLIDIDPPDLVLLDVMLPDVNGNEICRRLKQNPKTAPISVLMLTALQTQEDVDLAYHAGADGFVNKPYNAKQMIAQIEALLKRRE